MINSHQVCHVIDMAEKHVSGHEIRVGHVNEGADHVNGADPTALSDGLDNGIRQAARVIRYGLGYRVE